MHINDAYKGLTWLAKELTKRPRDSQRSKVYSADRRVWIDAENNEPMPVEESPIPALAERLETVPDIQRWVNQITRSDWWENYLLPGNRTTHTKYYYPISVHQNLLVKDGRGRRSACGSFDHGFISMIKELRNKIIILHEIAHTITERKFAAHGPEYMRVFLDLIHEFIGENEAESFRAICDQEGVKYEDIGYTYAKDAA